MSATMTTATDQSLFGGKVQKRHLPAFPLSGQHQGLREKRLLLPQGELAQFHDGEPAMKYVAAIELRQGTIRGNHYHHVKREWLYVIRGKVRLVARDMNSGTEGELLMSEGDLAVIEPTVAHALVVTESGIAVECSPGAYNADDTFHIKIV